MKINYIKLENFIGIYAGMNRTCIEIDFKNNKNNIIILNAANGKGKTTLLSMLHPLRGTMDQRSDIVLPNETGHKIVDVSNNGDTYHIEHFYGKKNKSFISKNGTELNENGNIKSFNEIVKEELGIDEDYFKLGRLGSNVSNFIDFKSTDRKKYITEFIPSIEEYLIAFENVKEKYTSFNSQIKLIKGNIEKYAGNKDVDEIKTFVKQLDKDIVDYQEKINKLTNKIDGFKDEKEKIEGKIVDYVNNKTDYSIKDFDKEINDLTRTIDDDVDKIEAEMDKAEDKYNNFIEENKIRVTENIEEYIKSLEIKFNNRLGQYEEARKSLIKEENDTRTAKFAANDKMSEYTQKLKDLDNNLTEDQLENVQNELLNLEEKIKDAKTKLEYQYNCFTDKEIDEIEAFYTDDRPTVDPTKINFIVKDIIEKYDDIKAEYDLKYLNCYYEYLENSEPAVSSKVLNNKVIELKDLLTKINEDLNKIEGSLAYVDKTLPLRSENCTDDGCSFISEALSLKKENEPKYKELLELKNKKQKLLKSYEEKFDIASVNEAIDKTVKSLEKEIKNVLPEFICKQIFERKLLLTNNTMIIEEFKIDALNNIYSLNEKLNTLKDAKDKLVNKINSYNASKSLIDEYNNQLNEAKKEYSEAEQHMNDISDAITDIDIKIENVKLKICTCIAFYDINDKLKETTEKYDKYVALQKDLLALIVEYKLFMKHNSINELNEQLDTYKKSLKEIKTKHDENATAVTIIEDNLNSLKGLEEDFKYCNLIKEALNPKSGIPMVFADNFLKSIAVKANNLLNIAYEGQFMIKFDITATEFNIQVYKGDGTMLKDISLASQGETSLTNVSLSLAMLETMIKGYNVLYLDEIDCTLSTENRRRFIDMLYTQLETLNIEQCFVISHNNEFYDKNVDLILLEGHDCDLNDQDFMKGKNVIFKV